MSKKMALVLIISLVVVPYIHALAFFKVAPVVASAETLPAQEPPSTPEDIQSLQLIVPLGEVAILELAELFDDYSSVSASKGEIDGTVWVYSPEAVGAEVVSFVGVCSSGEILTSSVEVIVLEQQSLEIMQLKQETMSLLSFDDGPVLESVWPRVNGLYASWAKGGDLVRLDLVFNKPVSYTSGSLSFRYSTVLTGEFTYQGGSGSNTLSFGYRVPQSTEVFINLPVSMGEPCLEVLEWKNVVIDDGVYWSSGKRVGPNNNLPKAYNQSASVPVVGRYNLFIDNVAPYVKSVTTNSSNSSGDDAYGLNDYFYFIVEFNEPLFVGGTQMQLKFNNGGITGGGGNMAEWPIMPNLNWSDKVIVFYQPQNGQSTEVLNVVEVVPHSFRDQAGNLLSTAHPPQGQNLADKHHLRILVDDGEPQPRPYASAVPSKHETYIKELGVYAPLVTYASRSWPRDAQVIWYFWDQNGDEAAAKQRWEDIIWHALRNNGQPPAGVYINENGKRVNGPTEADAAGEFYLHYIAVLKSSLSYFSDYKGANNWTAGPYLIDRRPPQVSLPWDSTKSLKTNYLVPIQIYDAHSGVGQATYQWYRDGSPYGAQVTPRVDNGTAWAIAPSSAGIYQLVVRAEDMLGNSIESTSASYYVLEAAGGEGDISYSFNPTGRGASRVHSSKSISPALATIETTVQAYGNNILGQCFYAWTQSEEAPVKNDGRWRMFYDGLGAELFYRAEISPDSYINSGDWYLHIMAFDQTGEERRFSFDKPVVIDNTPPTVEFSPNGYGLTNELTVTVTMRDNFPFEYSDMSGGNFLLSVIPREDDGWYYLDPVDFAGVHEGNSITWTMTMPPEYSFLRRFIYEDRPAPPLQLVAMVTDGAGNEVEVASNPFYLDIQPPNVKVTGAPMAGASKHLQVSIDTHGEAGVEVCYAFNQGHWLKLAKISELEKDEKHYYVPEDAEWSAWQKVSPNMAFPIPEALSPGSHLLSLRFRDSFGNELMYPAWVFYDDDEDEHEDYGYGMELDVLWSKTLQFSYNPTYQEPTAPLAKITYSTLKWTNQNVVATLELTDDYGYPVVVTNNGGNNSYIFTENGSFSFTYRDGQGATRFVTAEVTWIDKVAPVASVRYSAPVGVKTRNSVQAEVYANEYIDFVEPDGSNDGVHLFRENGSHTFTLRDRAGNTAVVMAVVDFIDRTPPNIQVSYSTSNPVRGEKVQVWLSCAEEEFVVLNEPSAIRGTENGRYIFSHTKLYEFDHNASYTFHIEDRAGNSTNVTISVDNIRTVEPEVWVVLSPSGPTNGEVIVSLLSSERLTIINDQNQPLAEGEEIVFTQNGKRTLRYRDDLGNIFTKVVEVTSIDRQAPQISFSDPQVVVLGIGEAFNPLSGVTAWDNRDGNITASIVVLENPVDIDSTGTYTVRYSVSDAAGNSTGVMREVKVIGDSQMIVLINGLEIPLSREMSVIGRVLKIDCFGIRGDSIIRWAEGQQREGFFKNIASNGVDSAGRRYGIHKGSSFSLNLQRRGWYTIYVRDEDERAVYVQVYVDYR